MRSSSDGGDDSLFKGYSFRRALGKVMVMVLVVVVCVMLAVVVVVVLVVLVEVVEE